MKPEVIFLIPEWYLGALCYLLRKTSYRIVSRIQAKFGMELRHVKYLFLSRCICLRYCCHCTEAPPRHAACSCDTERWAYWRLCESDAAGPCWYHSLGTDTAQENGGRKIQMVILKGKFFHVILLDTFLGISWGWREYTEKQNQKFLSWPYWDKGLWFLPLALNHGQQGMPSSQLQFLLRKLPGINIWHRNIILNIFFAFWDYNSYTDKIWDAEHKHRLLISISYSS